jgi:hypothetical protein
MKTLIDNPPLHVSLPRGGCLTLVLPNCEQTISIDLPEAVELLIQQPLINSTERSRE